jgi:hypothetical protein
MPGEAVALFGPMDVAWIKEMAKGDENLEENI